MTNFQHYWRKVIVSGQGLYSIIDRVDSHLTEQYLNTFWRESKHFVPWENNGNFRDRFSRCKFNKTNVTLERLLSDDDTNVSNQSSLTQLKQYQHHKKNAVFAYYFKNNQCWLIGEVNHSSLTGYHRYGVNFYIVQDKLNLKKNEKIEIRLLENSQKLGSMLVLELGEPNALNTEKQISLITMIQNSEHNIRSFIERKLKNTISKKESDFRNAEQGLIFGHPFHIISKASSGFCEEDKNKYSPELGAEFCLHYFAVKEGSLIQLSSVTSKPILDPFALSQFEKILGPLAQDYVLHPCHPWQAKYLFTQSSFNELVNDKTIVSLGELGKPVWPTSSVRTVWQPTTCQFIKLAINIRITNFVRNNPLSELERAIDISRVINHHNKTKISSINNNESSNFIILPETHCQTLKTKNIDLQSSFSILFRKGHINKDEPQVLAFLLEEDISSGDTPIYRILQDYAKSQKTMLNKTITLEWWRQYLAISLIPMIRLYADHGISLEAHLQNCMMSFKQGYPNNFYVRDMEGACINIKDRCILPLESAACYSEEKAWFRFKYYVIVNHISHFIASISRTRLIEESDLWTLMIELLTSSSWEGTQTNNGKQTRYMHLIADLLTSPFLPAKMNMTSRFNQTSEKPGWIDIPNPMNQLKKETQNDNAA
jgi:siderophore synthetase component